MIVEAITVTAPTLALAHVTYLNTYKERPTDEWPHRRLYAVCTFLVRHHGQWLLWQVCTLLPLRHVVTRKEDDQE